MPPDNRTMTRLLITILSTLLIWGCAYKVEIQQGNSITTTKVDQLEIGMDRTKIKAIMGTPMLADPFHADRWDYLFTLRSDDRSYPSHRITLYFEDGKLASIDQQGPIPKEEYLETLER